MAVYHLSLKAVQRSTGRSAPAAAAYRSGELIMDQRTGQKHDYRRRRGVIFKQLLGWNGTRSALWNRAEHAERRRDARTAKEYEIALPSELSLDHQISLARKFARWVHERYGVAVDICLHNPHDHGDQRNVHAHLMCTTRQSDGWALGVEKASIEWSDAKRRDHGLPKAKVELNFARAKWAELVNNALADVEMTERVDHRSYQDRGIELIPQPKLGPSAAALRRRGEPTERGDQLDRILNHNEAIVLRHKLDLEIEADEAKLAELRGQSQPSHSSEIPEPERSSTEPKPVPEDTEPDLDDLDDLDDPDLHPEMDAAGLRMMAIERGIDPDNPGADKPGPESASSLQQRSRKPDHEPESQPSEYGPHHPPKDEQSNGQYYDQSAESTPGADPASIESAYAAAIDNAQRELGAAAFWRPVATWAVLQLRRAGYEPGVIRAALRADDGPYAPPTEEKVERVLANGESIFQDPDEVPPSEPISSRPEQSAPEPKQTEPQRPGLGPEQPKSTEPNQSPADQRPAETERAQNPRFDPQNPPSIYELPDEAVDPAGHGDALAARWRARELGIDVDAIDAKHAPDQSQAGDPDDGPDNDMSP